MPGQRTPMPSPKAANAITYCKGASIGLSYSFSLRSDSRARLPITVGDVLKQETSSSFDGNGCPPCGASGQRPNLINMKCRYFHSFTGCTRADCRFLHDEKPGDVVFHDGSEKIRQRPTEYIPPGPRAEVKIFIGNLSPGTLSSFVIDIASPFGEVKRCDVLKSNLSNGRCPAVLFMTSDAQATAVISALNAYTDPCGNRIYARKEYSRPVKEEPQASVKPVPKDGDCLFSAIKLGDKSTVREVAVDWIENHLDDDLWGGFTYRSYIEDEKKVKADAYIANMRKMGVWGGLPELYALAALTDIRLRVFEEVSTGVFKITASEFGTNGVDARDVCLRSDHYDSLSDVWPLDKQEVAQMESKKPIKPTVPTKPAPTPTKPIKQTKPAVENTPPKHGRGNESGKSALNRDGDGFCTPKKSSKVFKELYETFAVSLSFVALYDLRDDDGVESDTEQDAGLQTTRTDEEVATLTPNKPPVLSSMPPLNHAESPVSTITGVWAFENATRKGRVMTPSAHEFKMHTGAMDGWHVLRRGEYSDA